MKRRIAACLGCTILVTLGAGFVGAQERTFTGLIADEDLNCIQNPIKAPQLEKGTPPWDKTSCVLYWAHHAKADGKYVLYDPDAKAKYQLDDQKRVEPIVGYPSKVKITGTFDEATKTIHIKNIVL